MTFSKNSMVIAGIVFFFLTIMISFLSYYYREQYENNKKLVPLWHNEIMEEFYTLFERPLDPIHLTFYKKITSNYVPTKSLQIIKNDVKKYNKEVEEGKKKAKDSKIVIAGLLQNGAKQIPELIERCQKITSLFKDYRIVILENNSIDTSRKDLLYWAMNDDRVKILCQDPFVANSTECMMEGATGVKDTSPMPNRIRKMATLRNIYMDHIQHYYHDFDFLCVMDMDLEGQLFLDGFFHAVGLLGPKMDGVACNGMLKTDDDGFYYYDSFAYIEENDLPYMSDISQKSEHDDYVHIYMTQLYSNQMVPDRVRSAFGGCVLYNMKSILKSRYDFSPSTFMCEHTFFHQGKKIYVDPRMIFLITKNG
jgi:hypothetical protein